MDDNANLTEMQRGNSEHNSDSGLRLITPTTWDPKRLEWLWDQVKETEYSFDDTTEGNPHYFLGILFSGTSAFYEIGDEGLVVVRDIAPKVNAQIHFALWGKIGPHSMLEIGHEVLGQVFKAFELNRVTSTTPRLYPKAARLATMLGFRFEGTLREGFLRNGKYHDIDIYGLLRSEFYKGKVVH